MHDHPPPRRGSVRIAIPGTVTLEVPQRRSDVTAAIDQVTAWARTTSQLPPSAGAVARAKEVVFASGALTAVDGCPVRVVVAVSAKGGVTTSFGLPNGSDFSVTALNNEVAVVIYGKDWTGSRHIVEASHEEALDRVRAACHGTLTAAGPTAD